MRRLIPILEYIVANLNYVVKVSNITDNGDGTYTLESCDTFYITLHTTFDVSGVTWTVTDFNIDTDFTVKPLISGATFPNVSQITLPQIGFLSGTLKDAQGERGTIRRNSQEIIPVIWNREPMTLDRNRDFESPMYGELDLELYILNNCDTVDWFNGDHHKYCVEPMMNVSDRIFKFVDSRGDLFDEYTSERIIPRVYLGTQSENGYDERLFEENLSGIQSNFTLPITDSAIDVCCGG